VEGNIVAINKKRKGKKGTRAKYVRNEKEEEKRKKKGAHKEEEENVHLVLFFMAFANRLHFSSQLFVGIRHNEFRRERISRRKRDGIKKPFSQVDPLHTENKTNKTAKQP
jgi:hypothetical protein